MKTSGTLIIYRWKRHWHKPADKGGAIVLMVRTAYLKEGSRQLLDISTYQEVLMNSTFCITRRTAFVLHDSSSQGVIDYKTVTYLTEFKYYQRFTKAWTCDCGINRLYSISFDYISRLSSHTSDKTCTCFYIGHIRFFDQTESVCQSTVPVDASLLTLNVNSLYMLIEHMRDIEVSLFTKY